MNSCVNVELLSIATLGTIRLPVGNSCLALCILGSTVFLIPCVVKQLPEDV